MHFHSHFLLTCTCNVTSSLNIVSSLTFPTTSHVDEVQTYSSIPFINHYASHQLQPHAFTFKVPNPNAHEAWPYVALVTVGVA